MSVVGLIVILIILGVAVWLVQTYIPMPGWMKTLITVIIAVVALLLVLSAFGVWDEVRALKVPHL